MPDDTPTTPAQGSAASGDKGSTSTADGNARAAQPSTGNPDALLEQLSARIGEVLNPLAERLGKLENAMNGRARVKGSSGGDKNSPSRTSDDGAENSDATTDELRVLKGEIAVLRERDQARAQAEQAQRISKELDRAIEAGGFVRGEIIKEVMLPHLKIGQTGIVLYDRDSKVLGVEEALKARFGSDSAFLKPSASQGTGVKAGERASGVDFGGKKLSSADIEKMAPGSPEFKALKEQIKNRARG